jgi:Ca-activated chloride channel family protein
MLEQLYRSPWEFLSWEWFSPLTFFAFEWQNAPYLLLIFAIPLIFAVRWLGNWQTRQKLEVALRSPQLVWQPVSLLRYISYLVISLTLFFLLIALARPQKSNIQVEQTSDGIDILLLLDVSESMRLEDLLPNRLEAAKRVAIDFIGGRIFDRIGVVVFSGEAYSLTPLTTDYEMLKEYIAEVQYGLISEGGTAIGNALGVATNRLQESSSKTKVIILISDGDNTGGSLDPITAAQLAAYYNIKIYSIVIGTEGEVPFTDYETGAKKMFKNTINESVLREISRIGEGKFYRTPNFQALQEVFKNINQYEKSKIIEVKFKTTRDYYHIYLIWGMIFLLLWLFLKSSFLSNVLED